MSSPRYWRQLAAAGIVIAGTGAIQLAGGLVELARLGASDDAAFARIERQVTQRFDTMATALEALAVRLAARPAVIGGMRGDPNSAAALFDAVRAAPLESGVGDAAITVYDDMGAARAWTGRPSEIALERILGGQAFLIAPGRSVCGWSTSSRSSTRLPAPRHRRASDRLPPSSYSHRRSA